MDSEKVKKKFFDITPPPSVAAVPSAPAVPRRQLITVVDTTPPVQDPLLDASDNTRNFKSEMVMPLAPTLKQVTPKTPDVADTAITPDKAAQPEVESVVPTEDIVEIPSVDPIASTEAPDTDSNATNEAPVDEVTDADKETPVQEQYAVIDALPDPSEKAANDLKSSMQEPKIYDTTAYHVPIKNTEHSHGGVKMAFAFGAVFAAVLVAGVVYAMVKLGS